MQSPFSVQKIFEAAFPLRLKALSRKTFVESIADFEGQSITLQLGFAAAKEKQTVNRSEGAEKLHGNKYDYIPYRFRFERFVFSIARIYCRKINMKLSCSHEYTTHRSKREKEISEKHLSLSPHIMERMLSTSTSYQTQTLFVENSSCFFIINEFET